MVAIGSVPRRGPAVFSVRQSAPTDLSDIRRNLGEVVEGMREVRGFIFTHVENHDVALSDGPEMRYPRRPAGEPAEVAAVHGEHGAVPAVVSPPGNRSPDQPAGFGGQGFGGAQLRAAAAYGSNPPTAHRALARLTVSVRNPASMEAELTV